VIFGYIRIEGFGKKDFYRQLKTLKDFGAERIYSDCNIDEKSAPKRSLKDVLSYMHKGDTIAFEKGIRLANSMQGLKHHIETMSSLDIDIHFIKENFVIDGRNKSLLNSALTFVAQMETEISSRKAAAVLETARRSGKTGGRPPIREETIEKALALYSSCESVREAARLSEVSVSTIYRAIKKKKSQNKH